jgi:hypothetical protein
MTPQDPFAEDNLTPEAGSQEQAQASPMIAQAPTSQAQAGTPAPEQPLSQPVTPGVKSNKRNLGIAIGALLIIGGIAAIFVFGTNAKDKPASNPHSTSSQQQSSNTKNTNTDSSADSTSGGVVQGQQQAAKDSKRKVDINALQSQLEAYYANTGTYPTLAQMNDAAFRSQNMQGLDSSALKDPDGIEEKLVANPAKNVYAYTVTTSDGKACTGTNCAKFALTATLSDGSQYTKANLE